MYLYSVKETRFSCYNDRMQLAEAKQTLTEKKWNQFTAEVRPLARQNVMHRRKVVQVRIKMRLWLRLGLGKQVPIVSTLTLRRRYIRWLTWDFTVRYFQTRIGLLLVTAPIRWKGGCGSRLAWLRRLLRWRFRTPSAGGGGLWFGTRVGLLAVVERVSSLGFGQSFCIHCEQNHSRELRSSSRVRNQSLPMSYTEKGKQGKQLLPKFSVFFSPGKTNFPCFHMDDWFGQRARERERERDGPKLLGRYPNYR